MRNAGLDEAQVGIKIAGRNIKNLRYANDTTLMGEREELKNFLMKVKEESEKVGLKLNIQKMKIMASGPITSWQIDRETAETVSDFIFLGSKITADGDCSHEIKWCLLLGRKFRFIYLQSTLFGAVLVHAGYLSGSTNARSPPPRSIKSESQSWDQWCYYFF